VHDHMVEETADLDELVDELFALRGIDRARVTIARREKNAKRGGFAGRILMLEGVKETSE
jgi:predicted house-cleaning noncanonical NTP pyrophosphatase (MazG superfamily)